MPTSIINIPAARANHTAVWTGIKMVIWGGGDGSSVFNTGGIYDPVNDSWDSTTTSGAPVPRSYHSAVWTGSSMIIWGGVGTNYFNTGGKYTNPTLVGLKTVNEKIPSDFALMQNFPNPFNPITKIKFEIPPSKGRLRLGST